MENILPTELSQFILEKIDSVAQLEALLLCRENPKTGWTLAELSNRLYISEAQAGEVLNRLSSERLLVPNPGEPDRYHFEPATQELSDVVAQLAEAYSKHLVPVTNLIHSKPKSRLQEFADAFRLRKDQSQ